MPTSSWSSGRGSRRSHDVRVRDAASQTAGLTSTSSLASRMPACQRPTSPWRRTRRASSTPPGPTCAARRSTRRCARGAGRAAGRPRSVDRREPTSARGHGTGRASTPVGSSRPCAPCCQTTPRSATDAGNIGRLARAWLPLPSARSTFLGPASGAMGFGLPAAIAASLDEPDRIAVAFCGDGGLAMTMVELETSVREDARPIVARLRKSALQRRSRCTSCERVAARPRPSWALWTLAAVARAHGALGFSVTNDADFEPALREAIAARKTSLLHVTLDRAWVSVDDNPFT